MERKYRKILAFLAVLPLCFSFGCRDKDSVCITFKQREIENGNVIGEKVIAKKWIKKGETLTSFPTLSREETDFVGYRLTWVENVLKPYRKANFEDITSDMTVWAHFVEYKKTPLISYAQTLPQIDGKIDDMWNSVPKFKTEYGYDEKFQNQATGYASLMWREEGLYFLGVVKDSTLCAQDHCCFWVGERLYDDRWFPTDKLNGNYQACANYDGKNMYHNGSDYDGGVIGSEGTQIKGSATSDGYIVEMFVPRQSKTGEAKHFQAGDYIGFDFSINDYQENSVERAHRCSWYHDVPTDSLGAYQNEGYIYKVELANK